MTDTDVRDVLHDVLDPEIGMNIVDLGIVYNVQIWAWTLRVTMAMTNPTCSLRENLQGQVASRFGRLWWRRGRSLEIVSDPVWTADRMSDAVRRLLQ